MYVGNRKACKKRGSKEMSSSACFSTKRGAKSCPSSCKRRHKRRCLHLAYPGHMACWFLHFPHSRLHWVWTRLHAPIQHKSSSSMNAESSLGLVCMQVPITMQMARRAGHSRLMTVTWLLHGQAPSPQEGCSGVPAQLMLLCLPGHLNSPTRDTALQPLCAHVLAREMLKGIRPETVGLEDSLRGPVL